MGEQYRPPLRIGRFYRADDNGAGCGIRLPSEQVVDLPMAGESTGTDIPRETASLLEHRDWRTRIDEALKYAKITGTGLVDADVVYRSPQ